MDVMMPMTASDSHVLTRRPTAAVTSEHTLKIEAARAGVGVGEYQARLRQGLLWCYRCRDWHQADAFPADARRHSGRAGSCHQAIRAAVRDALASRGQFPAPAAVWVIRRPGPASTGFVPGSEMTAVVPAGTSTSTVSVWSARRQETSARPYGVRWAVRHHSMPPPGCGAIWMTR